MNQINIKKQELEMLRKSNFSRREIARLCQLRRTYGQDPMDGCVLDRHRLEFARWLVLTGRLTDRIR